MSKPSFTPGPWTACFSLLNGHPVGFHVAASPHGSCKPIVECGFTRDEGMESTDEVRANGYAIAAMPELHDAVANFLGFLDNAVFRRQFAGDEFYLEMIRQGRAALAKARGEAC
jgi:hypothetical protein